MYSGQIYSPLNADFHLGSVLSSAVFADRPFSIVRIPRIGQEVGSQEEYRAFVRIYKHADGVIAIRSRYVWFPRRIAIMVSGVVPSR